MAFIVKKQANLNLKKNTTFKIPRAPFLPSSLGGLSLWLKADAGVTTFGSYVLGWEDQSGNGRGGGADQGSPLLISSAINGKPAIEFNGVDDRIYGEAPTTALPATVIIVAKPLGAEEIGMMYEQFGDGDNTAFYRWNGGLLRIYDGVDLTSETNAPSSFQIFGAIINGADSEIYINGSLDVSGDSGGFTPSGNYYLAYWAGGDTYTNVQIAEVIVYNRVLTTLERQQVEVYLNKKYAIFISKIIISGCTPSTSNGIYTRSLKGPTNQDDPDYPAAGEATFNGPNGNTISWYGGAYGWVLYDTQEQFPMQFKNGDGNLSELGWYADEGGTFGSAINSSS